MPGAPSFDLTARTAVATGASSGSGRRFRRTPAPRLSQDARSGLTASGAQHAAAAAAFAGRPSGRAGIGHPGGPCLILRDGVRP